LRSELEVRVAVEYSTEPAVADAVVSELEEEVLISDKLAGVLGIIVYDFGEGLWKLKSDPENTIRRSFPRQAWCIPPPAVCTLQRYPDYAAHLKRCSYRSFTRVCRGFCEGNRYATCTGVVNC